MTTTLADIYDLGLVWRFLGQNSEYPDTEEGLRRVLCEHRTELRALAARVQATPPGLADMSPATLAARHDQR